MLKKIIGILLIFALLLGVAACTAKEEEKNNGEQDSVSSDKGDSAGSTTDGSASAPSATSEPFEEDEKLTTIQNPGFEEGLKGWKVLSGAAFNEAAISASSEQFWGSRDYHAVGNYFLNGYNNDEAATGEIRSSKFTLAGDGFISFLIGGAGSKDCWVAIHDGNNDSELIRITNDYFQDPVMVLNMYRVYADASAYLGKVIYIKIVDNAAGGPFGAITVDDFHVSMTQSDVQALMLTTYKYAMSLEDNNVKDFYTFYDYPFELPVLRITQRVPGQAIYAGNPVDLTKYLADVKGEKAAGAVITSAIENIVSPGGTITSGFDKADLSAPGVYTVNYYILCEGEKLADSFTIAVSAAGDILNGDFETGDLAGWKVLTPETLKADNAISSDSTFWGEEIPYNSHGKYHFNGWGAQHAEEDAFSIRSSNFTLGGSGWISWRMGGNAAAVLVYKANGTLIGTYLNTAFADINFPNLDDGCRLATMTTFAVDLSAHLGEELYIELHDLGSGPWAVAFFDNIIVRHDNAVDVGSMSDEVLFNKRAGDDLIPTTFKIPWELAVNAG